jgi:hypothetical protein
MRSTVYAAAFATGAFALMAAIEVLLIAGMMAAAGGYTVAPRGPGWVVLPITAAIAGWRYGAAFDAQGSTQNFRLRAAALSSGQRLWLGGAAIWLGLSVVFFAIFDPFGRYYWTSVEWTKFLFICVAPPVGIFLATKVLNWSSRA